MNKVITKNYNGVEIVERDIKVLTQLEKIIGRQLKQNIS